MKYESEKKRGRHLCGGNNHFTKHSIADRKKKESFHFLVVDTELYKRLCPSVRPSVGPSVMVIEMKSGKTSVFDTFCVCLSVGGGLGCGWGLDAPAHPSATIL